MRSVIHIDMDAFFASVEQLDQPQLRGKPVVVGGGKRGVVAAASYEARKFGVRSAMPIHWAHQRCPQLVVCPPRSSRYSAVSRQVFDIFSNFTDMVEGLSIDEAFLDVTASEKLFGPAPHIASKIRAEIASKTGLTASAGVAPNKLVAKIASALNKPNGQVVVFADQIAEFMAPLPVHKLFGLGPLLAEHLKNHGVHTLRDLQTIDPARAYGLLGARWQHLVDRAWGQDERAVVSQGKAKSIGSEGTVAEDIATQDAIQRRLLAHSQRVSQRLTDKALRAKVISIKLKDDKFQVVSRQESLQEAISDTRSIYQASCRLLEKTPWRGKQFRLVGVSATQFIALQDREQLFETPERLVGQKVEQAAQLIRNKYGNLALTRADLLTTAKDG